MSSKDKPKNYNNDNINDNKDNYHPVNDITNAFEPYTASRQAVLIKGQKEDLSDEKIQKKLTNRDLDGERIYLDFGIKPFYKVLRNLERKDHPVAKYPSAYLANLLHLTKYELWELEDQELDLEQYPKPRRKVLEWVLEDPERIDKLEAGGTDFYAYSKPGKGKTTVALDTAIKLMQLNNETCIWAGTSNETEWIPLAPYTTVALPERVKIDVTATPMNPDFGRREISFRDIARDVIYYKNPEDLVKKLIPGQFYVVFPDPHFRECERLTGYNYNDAWSVNDATKVTPTKHWWFAFWRARLHKDLYMHRTSIFIDELRNLLYQGSAKDEHDTLQKVEMWIETMAEARKKNVSFFGMSHTLGEIHHDFRDKLRWIITMNNTPLPEGSVKRIGKCPVPDGWTSKMSKGEAVIWRGGRKSHYAPISTPNLKKIGTNWKGEISVTYTGLQRRLRELERMDDRK